MKWKPSCFLGQKPTSLLSYGYESGYGTWVCDEFNRLHWNCLADNNDKWIIEMKLSLIGDKFALLFGSVSFDYTLLIERTKSENYNAIQYSLWTIHDELDIKYKYAQIIKFYHIKVDEIKWKSVHRWKKDFWPRISLIASLTKKCVYEIHSIFNIALGKKFCNPWTFQPFQIYFHTIC